MATTWPYLEAYWPVRSRLKRVQVAASGGRGYLSIYAQVDTLGRPVSQLYFAGAAPHLTQYDDLEAAQAHAFDLPVNNVLTLPDEVEALYLRLHYVPRDDEQVEVRAMHPVLLNASEV